MSEPIRAAQVLGRMDSGGVEAVVLNYYRHIDKSSVQFDFFFDGGSSLPCRQELEELGAGLYPLPACSHLPAYLRALTAALRESGCSLAHVHLNTLSVFALFAARRAGLRVRICHSHSTGSLREGPRALPKLLLRPFAGLFATQLCACSGHAARWLFGARRLARGQVRILPNAIEPEAFAFDPDARRGLRRELGIAPEAFVIGHVGRFMPQKNHGFLLKVFAEAAARRPDAVLLLVGEGPGREACERRAAALGLSGRVIFTGARRDAARLYSAMDVFCLPSLYEGFGMVAVEAQVNGLFCLCSDRVPRETDLWGEAAFLPLRDGARWAEALLAARRGPGRPLPEPWRAGEQAARLAAFYAQLVREAYGP